MKERLITWAKANKVMVGVTSLLILVGLIWTGVATIASTCKTIDSRYAKASQFTLLSMRLDQKITRDEINWRRQKCASWLGKYGSVAGMPPEIRIEYERMQAEIKDYEAELRPPDKVKVVP
jgi:hypothetical protein